MSKENSRNNKQTSKKKRETENKTKKTKTKSKDTRNIIKEEKKEIKKVIEEKVDNNYVDEDLEDFDERKTKEKNKEKAKEVIEEKVDNNYIDEDLEDFDENYEEEEEKKSNKPFIKEEKIIKDKKEKKKKKEEEISKEKIKKIENLAKEKKRKKQKRNENLAKIGHFLETNRYIIYSFVIGVLLTVFIVILIWPTRIATLKNGEEPIVKVAKNTYTADDLYKQMKDHYSVSQLLDKIDNDLLTKMYPETEEMTKEVKENAEYYINMYKQYYNYTEEQFLSSNGFSSYDAFLEYLKLENRRKKYLKQYVEDNLTDKEIENYYNKNVYGDINCQHVLVETSSDSSSSDSKKKKLSDEEGKKLAEEIISKINDGTSWKDIQKNYKDKVTFEDLGYQSWDSDLEDSFKTALKEMDNKSYSKEPVKTSYGYHVIYRIDQKKTPELKKVKTKIIEKLVAQKQKDDSNLQYKALINLRKDKNIKFYDTDLQKKYDNYIKQYK